MVLDDDRKQVILCSSFGIVKHIGILTSESNYNQFLQESTTKWSISDETSFNDIKNEIISSFS